MNSTLLRRKRDPGRRGGARTVVTPVTTMASVSPIGGVRTTRKAVFVNSGRRKRYLQFDDLIERRRGHGGIHVQVVADRGRRDGLRQPEQRDLHVRGFGEPALL